MTRLSTVLAAAALIMAQPMHAQNYLPAIDSMMARYAKPGGPGASVLVVKDCRVVVAKGYGLADVEKRRP